MRSLLGLIPIFCLFGLEGCADKTASIGGSGMLEANESLISAETTGRIEAILVTEGTPVTPGAPLLIIDTTKLTLTLENVVASREVAQAQLQAARVLVRKSLDAERFMASEAERLGRLAAEGSATTKQLDAARFEASQASLALESARAQATVAESQITKLDAEVRLIHRQLADCKPLAPIAGHLTELLVDPGEVVTQGKAIARIARLDTLRVRIYLSTGDFARVKIGDAGTVSTESGGSTYTGQVVWTSDEAEFTPKNVQTASTRANLVYAVELAVPNADGTLKIGMPVFVTLDKP